MLLLVAPVVMKKKHVLKNVFSRIVMSLVNGTRRTSVLSCGIFSTVVKTRANTSVYSPLVTGLKWMYGIIYGKKTFLFLPYILHTKEKLFTVIIHGCLFPSFSSCAKVKRLKEN